MNTKIKEKRKILNTLTNAAKKMAEVEGIYYQTINDLLINYVYDPDQTHTFKSFKSWKAEGYTVKKGEHAYLLWGQPLKNQKKENESEQNKEENKDDLKYKDFFPLAFVFRDDQVFKPENKTQAKQIKRQVKTAEPVHDLPF